MLSQNLATLGFYEQDIISEIRHNMQKFRACSARGRGSRGIFDQKVLMAAFRKFLAGSLNVLDAGDKQEGKMGYLNGQGQCSG